MKSYFEILNEVIENIVKKKFISYKGAYGRFLYNVGANSIKLYKFYNNNNNNNYYFNSYEFEIAEEIYKKFFFNKKIKLIKVEKKKKFNKISILLKKNFFYIKLIFFKFLFSFKKKKRIKIIFYIHDQKYINFLNKFIIKNKNYYYLLLTNYKLLFNKNIKFKKCLRKVGEKYIFSDFRGHYDFEHNYQVFIKTFLKYKPQKVIFMEGDSPEHSNISRACKDLGIESLCLQWGSIPTNVPKYGFRNLECSKFLIHGKYIYNQLIKYNNKNILKIVGNASLDDFNFNNNKIIKKAVFLLQPKYLLLQLKEYELFLKFAYFVIKNNQDWSFVIKPHPSYNLEKKYKNIFNRLKNCRIVDTKKISLTETVANCDVAFSIYSSSLTDCINYDIIPFVFNADSKVGRYHPDLKAYRIGFYKRNYKSAILTASNLLKDNKKIYLLKKRIKNVKSFFSKDIGQKAVSNIIKYLQK